jgi:hypothetical protein
MLSYLGTTAAWKAGDPKGFLISVGRPFVRMYFSPGLESGNSVLCYCYKKVPLFPLWFLCVFFDNTSVVYFLSFLLEGEIYMYVTPHLGTRV